MVGFRLQSSSNFKCRLMDQRSRRRTNIITPKGAILFSKHEVCTNITQARVFLGARAKCPHASAISSNSTESTLSVNSSRNCPKGSFGENPDSFSRDLPARHLSGGPARRLSRCLPAPLGRPAFLAGLAGAAGWAAHRSTPWFFGEQHRRPGFVLQVGCPKSNLQFSFFIDSHNEKQCRGKQDEDPEHKQY